MPVITQTIALNEEVNLIQEALVKVGYTISPHELFTANVAGTFGTQTQAALIDFIKPLATTDDLGEPFHAAWGRLLHIMVPVELGNSAGLYEAARECFEVIEAPPVFAWIEHPWLARYAIIGRNFTTAKQNIDQLNAPDPIMKALVDETPAQRQDQNCSTRKIITRSCTTTFRGPTSRPSRRAFWSR